MYSQISTIVFSVTVNCVVLAYFLFAPFRTRFRYNYLKTAMLVALLTTLTVIMSVLFLTSGLFFSDYSTVGILLWIICALLTFHIAIKGSSFEILFIVLVILNLYVNIGVITKVFMIVFHFDNYNSLLYTLIRIVILIASIPFIWLLLGKLYRQLIEFNIYFSFWKFIWAIPALMYLIFYTKLIPDYWKHPIGVGKMDIAFAFLWAVTTYVVFCITLLMLIQNYKGITAQQQTQMITAQLKMQEGQYEKLLEHIENTARLRHDWRHHLLTINSFVETGRIEELQSYLESLNPNYIGIEAASVCENHIVDVILQHYAAIAKVHNITVAIMADVPKSLTIADTDLCVIFGNLVENAVEACSSQDNADKCIEIKAKIKGRQLALLVKNTYQKKVMIRDNMYYSTKHEGVGIGLSSVQKVVKNNNGTMKIDFDERNFKVYALFDIYA